jgi:predicted nuclease with RNAse H fold
VPTTSSILLTLGHPPDPAVRDHGFAPRPLAVGIDVAEERKGLDLVALDEDLAVVASAGRLTVAGAVAMVLRELKPAVVCIDSPSGWSLSGPSRRAERELRPLGISAFACGPDPGPHPFYRWMRIGFSLFESLAPAYGLFQGGRVTATAAEVFPEATAVLLAGGLRTADETKRSFRARVLTDHGVDVTRLPTVDRIDAALAALTGILALAGTYTTVGDPAEGVILLPVSRLPTDRLVRSPVVPSANPELAATQGGSTIGGAHGQCGCGCGAKVRRRFLPGHDAKLKSALMRARAAGDAAAISRLAELGWLPFPTIREDRPHGSG